MRGRVGRTGFLSPKKRKNVFEGKGIFLLLNPGFRFSTERIDIETGHQCE